MKDGPEANPALAAKMLKQFEDVGLVLLRGQPALGDNLHIMKEWAQVCMPNLVKYEGGANTRHGKIENVYEVGAPTVGRIQLKFKDTIAITEFDQIELDLTNSGP